MTREDLLIQHGESIIKSEYFHQARHQVHHLRSDLASHSIHTALICISIRNILKFFHIRINLSVLIPAALAHDLGMLDRYSNFTSGWESLNRHPECSAQTIRQIIPNPTPQITAAIASHMYPLGYEVPSCPEAWILCLADKYAACTDWFLHYDSPNRLSA